jgi:manganese transport protein
VFAVALPVRTGEHDHRTLAGQIVMEGFLHMDPSVAPATHQPWARVIPAAIFIAIRGEGRWTVARLLASRLEHALFAVLPLIAFTSSRAKMGEFRAGVGDRAG